MVRLVNAQYADGRLSKEDALDALKTLETKATSNYQECYAYMAWLFIYHDDDIKEKYCG